MQVEVVWHDDGGPLSGWVEVVNDDATVLRLPGKPWVSPLAVDGSELDLPHVITLEMRLPGYLDLLPGQRARAPISWGAWDGPAAGRDVLVRWADTDTGGGDDNDVHVKVAAQGPRQPTSTTGGLNTSSSWFELVPKGRRPVQ